ncbi:hypothetical protein AA313_de0207075 [Arthrobotrys entomopaga]|nr:hypothetical protein AA313_de0207075 [Arthrobotrys entomopaga]
MHMRTHKKYKKRAVVETSHCCCVHTDILGTSRPLKERNPTFKMQEMKLLRKPRRLPQTRRMLPEWCNTCTPFSLPPFVSAPHRRRVVSGDDVYLEKRSTLMLVSVGSSVTPIEITPHSRERKTIPVSKTLQSKIVRATGTTPWQSFLKVIPLKSVPQCFIRQFGETPADT